MYHLSTGILQRSKGHSAVNQAAYDWRTQLEDERLGLQTTDWSHKRDELLAGGMILPDQPDLPAWTQQPGTLANKVEATEKRGNAQVGRTFIVALPDMTHAQQVALARDFTQQAFAQEGLCGWWAKHAPDKENNNHHLHLYVAMRRLDGQEFAQEKSIPNSREIGIKSWTEQTTQQLRAWRVLWDRVANLHLEQAGYAQRIDHRSYKDQGLQRIPTIHLGPRIAAMERKGIQTERGDINRAIRAHNKELGVEQVKTVNPADVLAKHRAMREERYANKVVWHAKLLERLDIKETGGREAELSLIRRQRQARLGSELYTKAGMYHMQMDALTDLKERARHRSAPLADLKERLRQRSAQQPERQAYARAEQFRREGRTPAPPFERNKFERLEAVNKLGDEKLELLTYAERQLHGITDPVLDRQALRILQERQAQEQALQKTLKAAEQAKVAAQVKVAELKTPVPRPTPTPRPVDKKTIPKAQWTQAHWLESLQEAHRQDVRYAGTNTRAEADAQRQVVMNRKAAQAHEPGRAAIVEFDARQAQSRQPQAQTVAPAQEVVKPGRLRNRNEISQAQWSKEHWVAYLDETQQKIERFKDQPGRAGFDAQLRMETQRKEATVHPHGQDALIAFDVQQAMKQAQDTKLSQERKSQTVSQQVEIRAGGDLKPRTPTRDRDKPAFKEAVAKMEAKQQEAQTQTIGRGGIGVRGH